MKTCHAILWSSAAVILSFLIAVALDAIFRVLRAQAQSTFHVMPAYLFQAATPVILACLMLALVWVLFAKTGSNPSAAVIFLVLGLIILVLYFSRFIPGLLPARTSPIRRIQILLLESGTRSSLFHLASFWTVAGAAAILRPRLSRQPRPK